MTESDLGLRDSSGFFGYRPWADWQLNGFTKYTYDVKFTHLDERRTAISQLATEFVRKNSARERYSSLKDFCNRDYVDKIAFLRPPGGTKNGYALFRKDADEVWDLLGSIRNTIVEDCSDLDVDSANWLLVNYAKKRPLLSRIIAADSYRVDESLYDVEFMHAYRKGVDVAFSANFAEIAPDRIGVTNKKLTALGYPNEHIDGTPITREEVFWGLSSDLKADPVHMRTRMLADRSKVKSEWRESDDGCRRIFGEQMELLAKRPDGRIEGCDVAHCIEKSLITVVKPSFRENCPDGCNLGREPFRRGMSITQKDRNFIDLIKDVSKPFSHDRGFDPIIMEGMIDNTKYNELSVAADPTNEGAGEVQRGIYPSNNMMHTNGTYLARATTKLAEDSYVGHPSTNAQVKEAWESTGVALRQLGYEVHLYAGDCKNAEETVQSNPIYWEEIPERFVPYLRLTSSTVTPIHANMHYEDEGYCSAVWFTTWRHLIKGNFEALHWLLLAYKLKGITFDRLAIEKTFELLALYLFYHTKDRNEKLREYSEFLFMVDDRPSGIYVGGNRDFIFSPNLGTDDIAGRHAERTDLKWSEADAKKLSEVAKTCMMSYECFLDENVSFGMHQTATELVADVGTNMKKMFTSERMGFVLRDGFATYIRIKNCGHTDVVDYYLKKKYGVGVEAYAVFQDLFPNWLAKTGCSIGDVFNEYSPVERILIGKAVGIPEGEIVDEVVLNGVHWNVGHDGAAVRQIATTISSESNTKFKNMLHEAFWRS